jgi:methylmalonyl-CoA mutase
VVVGGVIPANDYEFLKAAGVGAVFGPGSNITQSAAQVLRLIRDARRAA